MRLSKSVYDMVYDRKPKPTSFTFAELDALAKEYGIGLDQVWEPAYRQEHPTKVAFVVDWVPQVTGGNSVTYHPREYPFLRTQATPDVQDKVAKAILACQDISPVSKLMPSSIVEIPTIPVAGELDGGSLLCLVQELRVHHAAAGEVLEGIDGPAAAAAKQ